LFHLVDDSFVEPKLLYHPDFSGSTRFFIFLMVNQGSVSTTYYYRVISFNGGGDLGQSTEASATTQAAPPSGGGGSGGCFISTAAFGL